MQAATLTCACESWKCEEAATSLHWSLSEPNRIPAAAAIIAICTADDVPLHSAEEFI